VSERGPGYFLKARFLLNCTVSDKSKCNHTLDCYGYYLYQVMKLLTAYENRK
jgi:hypothetical protein